MAQKLRNDYLLLTASLVLLVLGWGFGQFWAYALAATLGFLLALNLVVAAIREREFGSDGLALLAIVGSALINEWFAAAVITVMLATGRSLERWAQGRANSRLESLLNRAPKLAHRIGDAGQLVDTPLAQVLPGSRILVRAGEVIPLDGTAVSACTIDESALTGEPIPREVAPGAAVTSGTVNAGQSFELVTTSTESDSTYSALIRLVAQSKADSAAGVRLANRWAIWFVPLALFIALAAWLLTGEVANAVAVVVAATPCPLILAVPIAIISGMSRSAASGSIVKGGQALEQLARARAVMLDKTGTLTQGGPQISFIVVSPGQTENEVLRFAASLEQASPHIVARAIVREAEARSIALTHPTETSEQHGHGLTGKVDGARIRVGQPTQELPDWAAALHTQHPSALLVAVEQDARLIGLLGLDDPVRAESASVIAKLHRLGVSRVIMATGDRQQTAEAVAIATGIDEVLAECTPERKLAEVQRLKQDLGASQGRGTVLAVGDGINDAPALAAADVGIAMGAKGATAASEAADVVILEDSLAHLPLAIAIAQGAMRRAKQSALVGIGLSIVAMLAGAMGLLSPAAAAISQEAIDACAILWALVPARIRD